MTEWIEANPGLYAWLVLPLLIFVARVVDVTLGTMRVFFVSRGYKKIAPVVGFVEVLIWLVAIGFATRNLANPMCLVAFAMGFAAGNYLGITLTERLSLGTVLVRVLTHENADALIASLKAGNYGLTCVDGYGAVGPMKVILTIVQRQKLDEVLRIIRDSNPKAFYTIEEVGEVSEGKLTGAKFPAGMAFLQTLMPFRKGK
jgi:uncharacterized protein YebE (UPF0316 family)